MAEARTARDDEFVIGEAVALDVAIAGLPVRIGGIVIDAAMQGFALIAIFWLLSDWLAELDSAMASAVSLICVAAVLIIFPATVETLTSGRSLGKLAFGTRVVRDDFGPISARHAMVRALMGVFEGWMTGGMAAGIAAILNRREKRLGDMAAGTVVIRDRLPLIIPTPAPMPLYLAAWAQGADIGSLSPGLAMSVRQFLSRRFALSPQSREKLGLDLAIVVMKSVAPSPPAGAHPEDVLAAVMVERGRRDALRLERENQLRKRWLGWS